MLLAGGIVALLLVSEAFRRLAASAVIARARTALTALTHVHISAAETVITLAAVRDVLHAIGIRVFRSPARSS